MAVVHAAIEFFDAVDYILGHFEMNFPSFEEMLQMKHVWQPDKAQWTHFVRLLHLQAQFKDGWVEELCFNGRSNLFQATHKKLDEIASWNLKTVDDAKAIIGEAEAQVKELKETVIQDVKGIKRMPDDTEAKACQVLENVLPLISFSLDDVPITGALNVQDAAAIVKKLEKRKKTISDEISKVQDAISDLGQIKEAREEVACFFATHDCFEHSVLSNAF